VIREESSAATAPLVSVIVPAYGAARYIGGTLDSVFAQTFTDYEVIVVNDGSPDSQELEHVLASYRKRIRYVVQENRGLAGARNTGIEVARGRFFAFLDADDQWEPEYLAFQVATMQADPTIDVHYTDGVIFGSGAHAGRALMELNPSHREVTFHRLITRECVVPVCAALVRREAVLGARMFDPRLSSRCEDVDLWLRIAQRGGRIAWQPRRLARYRIRHDSLSADAVRMVETYLQVLAKTKRIATLTPSDHEVLDRQITFENATLDLLKGKEALLTGDVHAATFYLRRANSRFHRLRVSLALLLLRLAPRLFVRFYRHWRPARLAKEDAPQGTRARCRPE
jgi:glycosyltransferase involved in cell wall biosynthesis